MEALQAYLEQAMTELRDLVASQKVEAGKDVMQLKLAVDEVRSMAEVAGQRSEDLESKLAGIEATIAELGQRVAPVAPDPGEREAENPWKNYKVRSLNDAEKVPVNFIRSILGRDTISTTDFPKTPQAGTPVALSQYPVGLLDRLRMQATRSNTVDVIRESKNSALGYGHYSAAAAYANTDTTITLDSVDGLVAGTDLRISNGTSTVTKEISSINTSTKVVTLTAAIGITGTTGDDVWSTTFGVIAEAGTKPYGDLATSKTTKTMKTIPVVLAVTEQLLKDSDIQSWIRDTLAYKVRASAEWHILYGDGSSNQLDGFATDTDVQTHLWSNDPTGCNRIDGVIYAGNEIRSAGQVLLVLCRYDWARLRVLKDSNGRYIAKTQEFGIVDISVTPGNLSIDQYPVVLSEAVVPGDFFLVDPAKASTLWVRDSGSLQFGWINDDFLKNQQAARYEMELVHAIEDPYAYVYGQWDSAP